MGVACIGIDPGLDGGIALIRAGGELAAMPTPTFEDRGKRQFDLVAMSSALRSFGLAEVAAIEKVAARPGQGVTSMFRFGFGYGAWMGLLAGLGIPCLEVTPQAWKKAVLPAGDHDKQAAIGFVRRRWPGVSLLATPRSRVPHDGMADAACIAEWCRLHLNT